MAKDKLTPPAPASADAAAPGTPPPPPPPPPPAEAINIPAAAAPPPTPGAPAAGAVSPDADLLFYFRKGDRGAIRSDLEALQEAVTSYDRRAGLSMEADKPAWPIMKDLSDLVKVGALKALPEAPAGQKYAYDAKTRKVTLVGQ